MSLYLTAVAVEARRWHARGDTWTEAIDTALGFVDPTLYPDGPSPLSFPTLRERVEALKIARTVEPPEEPSMGYGMGEDAR